jgi:serine/threonine protein kinase
MIKSAGQFFVGQTLDDRYRLKRVVGAGTFGVVLEADLVVGGTVLASVAVKVLPRMDAPDDQLGELKAAVDLNHPSLVRCLSVGEASLKLAGEDLPVLYLAMELGQCSLEERLEDGALDLGEARHLGVQIGGALDYLRSRNRVHRDLKPSNVLRFGDTWKLADLGILHELEAGSTANSVPIGTLHYMPPEAHFGIVSPSWDVWSLGVTLMKAVTNQLPYQRNNRAGWISRILSDEPTIDPRIPEPLKTVVQGCLRRDRTRRLVPMQVVGLLRESIDDDGGRQSVSILGDLRAKFPDHLRPEITDVLFGQTTDRCYLEVRKARTVAGYLVDEDIKRTDLAFISGEQDDEFYFNPSRSIAFNIYRFVNELGGVGIINCTDLFTDEAADAISRAHNGGDR